MKRVLLMICSILLVCACVFGLFACAAGLKDIMNIKDYKQADADMANEGIATARDGISQLKENEQVYLDGVNTYNSGLAAYADGQKQLAAGEAELAAGQKLIDDNTQAYNEGKEKLATIEPLLPLIDTYQQFRNGTIAKLPGFETAQAWFAQMVKPLGAQLGLELPDDVSDLPAYIDEMVADGKVQLKTYEDGLVALEEGKAQLADGKAQLADGAKQLADGDAQLSVYEDGQAQLADGMLQLIDQMVPCGTEKRGETVPSLAKILGDDFHGVYALNDDGSVKKVRGCDFVDLDACSAVCDGAEEYLSLQEADITGEVLPRIAIIGMMAVASVLGLIAGIFGIVASITGGIKTGKKLGIVSAILAVAANVVGLITGYTDYIYPTRNVIETAGVAPEDIVTTYSGDLQFKAVVVLAVVAVLFVIFASIARKAAKKKVAQAKAQANAAAASVAAKSAETANTERLARLEAENAELKAMVGSLAEETVKE